MAEQPMRIKMVVVGDGCVGKTCVLVSYVNNKFPKEYEPTIFDNLSTTIKIDGKIVNLGLWDTAGQEEYNRLRPLAYPNSDVVLIVFSVIDPDSFVNAKKKWYPELQETVPKAIKVFLGNKIDLREEYQSKNLDSKKAPISKETARRVIEEEMGCKYMECSALTQDGLREVFQQSVRAVIKLRGVPVTNPNGSSSSFCQLI